MLIINSDAAIGRSIIRKSRKEIKYREKKQVGKATVGVDQAVMKKAMHDETEEGRYG